MTKLRLAGSALLAATCMAVVLGVTSPAQADTPARWVNTATSYCLDSNASGDVYTLGCNGGNFQRWHNHAGTYGRLQVNYATGRCLDSNANGSVYTRPCQAGNRYQNWVLSRNTYGYQLRNVATGRCLDSNTARSVYTRPCNAGNFQRWHR